MPSPIVTALVQLPAYSIQLSRNVSDGWGTGSRLRAERVTTSIGTAKLPTKLQTGLQAGTLYVSAEF